MTDLVKYNTGGDNTLLRYALFAVWGFKCYWCTRPRDFTIIEVDHIIPKSLKDEELDRALALHKLDPEFKLNALGNLAPICRPCNGANEKGDSVSDGAPIILSKLMKAEKLSMQVNTEVLRLKAAAVTARNIIEVANMEIEEETMRRLFADHAPSIVQKLANLEESLVDYTSYTGTRLDWRTGRPFVDLSFDNRGRFARDVISGVLMQPFNDVLKSITETVEVGSFELVKEQLIQDERLIPNDAGVTIKTNTPHNYEEYFLLSDLDFFRFGASFCFTILVSNRATSVAAIIRESAASEEPQHGWWSLTGEFIWQVRLVADDASSSLKIVSRKLIESTAIPSVGWN